MSTNHASKYRGEGKGTSGWWRRRGRRRKRSSRSDDGC